MLNQEALFPMPQTTASSDDYYTPKWLFEALGVDFDLDVACPPNGPLFTPAKHWYTQETDGLLSPWFGKVFMNPPYSKTGPWVHKWIEHGNGIALLPVLKHSQWAKKLWDSQANVVWINASQIKFHHKSELKTIWPIVWLWAIGDECVEALKNSNLGSLR